MQQSKGLLIRNEDRFYFLDYQLIKVIEVEKKDLENFDISPDFDKEESLIYLPENFVKNKQDLFCIS